MYISQDNVATQCRSGKIFNLPHCKLTADGAERASEKSLKIG